MLALVLAAAIGQVVPAGACRITGTVVDAATRAGVARAGVDLAPGARATTADENGHFAFGDLAEGAYRLTAAVPGFAASPPVHVTLAPDACDQVIEIEYRLAVTTNARAEPVSPTPTPIVGPMRTSLDATAIMVSPGAIEDVFRAFKGRPGVAASDDDRNDLLVRGGGAIENQTRIDGFDIPNPNHFGAQGGTGGGLSMVPPWLIREATLEPGGYSVAYGERASSVVNLSLRSGRADGLHGAFGASVGGVLAQAEGPIPGGRGTWLAAVRRSLLELVFTREQDHVVPRYADGVAKLDLALGASHSLTLLGLAGHDGFEAVSDTNADDRLLGGQTIGTLGVRIDSRWQPQTVSTFVASLGTSEVDARHWRRDVMDAIDRGREVELRLRGEVHRHVSRIGDMLTGVSLKRAALDFQLADDGMTTPYSRARRNIAVRSRLAFVDMAAFVDVTRRLPASAQLTAGFRLDRWGAPGQVLGSPRIKVEYPLHPSMRVVGSWGVFRQSLPYIWVGADAANVELSPIGSRHIEAGLELGSWRTWRVGIDAFDKRYRDYPVDAFEPSRVLVGAAADFESPFVGRLDGGGQLYARGIDTSATGRPWPNIHVSAGYSYWKVEQRGLDQVWRSAEHELRHQAQVEIIYRGESRWTAGLRWRYASGRPYTPYDVKASIRVGRGQYDLTALNAAHYDPYHRLDVRADRTFHRGRTDIVVFAEVDNVYDRDNLLTYTWSGTLRAPKSIYQWGRMPVAGVRVEF